MKNILSVKKDSPLQQAFKHLGEGNYKIVEDLIEDFLREYTDYDLLTLQRNIRTT